MGLPTGTNKTAPAFVAGAVLFVPVCRLRTSAGPAVVRQHDVDQDQRVDDKLRRHGGGNETGVLKLS